MTTSFNTIPSNTLVPLFYAEMDNQAANTAQDSGASLLIGHANNGAEIVANSLVLMPSADYARQICGAGIRAAITAELRSFLLRDGYPQGELKVSRISEAISGANGEYSHQLLAPVDNISIAKNELAVLGTISWT